MSQNVITVWLAATILLGAASFADPTEGPPEVNGLTNLPDYLRYAALHNAGLKAAFQQWKAAVESRYTAAAGSHPDIIRAQIELATLADKLESIEQMREPTVAKLNSILNRESDLPLRWPVRRPLEPIQINRQMVIGKLRANNPELKALDFDRAAAESKVELAKKRFYPDISLGLDWIQTDDARMAGTSDSGKDPIIAMISVNLPLWRDSYKAGRRQAEAKLRQVSAQRLQKENDIVAQTAKVLYEFEDSARKVALYADTLIPKAKEMLEASEVAYRAGTLDFLSLIDAQRTLLGFELLGELAVTDYLQRLAELEMLAGGEIE